MSRGLKWLSGVVVAGGIAFLATFAAFAALVLSYDPNGPVSGDAIVVLTGGDNRVQEGLRLLGEGIGRRVLISGVNPATTRRDLSHRFGLTPVLFNSVDVDYLAQDTLGNAAGTRDWLHVWGFKRLVVVTSNYHMPRSLLALRQALPGVDLVPHAVVPAHFRTLEWWHHRDAVKKVFSEYLKFIPTAAGLVVGRSRQPTQVAPTGLSLSHRPEVSSNKARGARL